LFEFHDALLDEVLNRIVLNNYYFSVKDPRATGKRFSRQEISGAFAGNWHAVEMRRIVEQLDDGGWIASGHAFSKAQPGGFLLRLVKAD
jgi:hypothetical protein